MIISTIYADSDSVSNNSLFHLILTLQGDIIFYMLELRTLEFRKRFAKVSRRAMIWTIIYLDLKTLPLLTKLYCLFSILLILKITNDSFLIHPHFQLSLAMFGYDQTLKLLSLGGLWNAYNFFFK